MLYRLVVQLVSGQGFQHRQHGGCLGLGGGRPEQRRLLRAEFPLDDALQLLFVQIEVLCADARRSGGRGCGQTKQRRHW